MQPLCIVHADLSDASSVVLLRGIIDVSESDIHVFAKRFGTVEKIEMKPGCMQALVHMDRYPDASVNFLLGRPQGSLVGYHAMQMLVHNETMGLAHKVRDLWFIVHTCFDSCRAHPCDPPFVSCKQYNTSQVRWRYMRIFNKSNVPHTPSCIIKRDPWLIQVSLNEFVPPPPVTLRRPYFL